MYRQLLFVMLASIYIYIYIRQYILTMSAGLVALVALVALVVFVALLALVGLVGWWL